VISIPIYEYQCVSCKQITEKFESFRSNSKGTKCEKCGQLAKRIISLPSTNCKDSIRYSVSMGIDPSQIKEAERIYPGSRYTPDGRLIIHHRKEKLERMKQRNYEEYN